MQNDACFLQCTGVGAHVVADRFLQDDAVQRHALAVEALGLEDTQYQDDVQAVGQLSFGVDLVAFRSLAGLCLIEQVGEGGLVVDAVVIRSIGGVAFALPEAFLDELLVRSLLAGMQRNDACVGQLNRGVRLVDGVHAHLNLAALVLQQLFAFDVLGQPAEFDVTADQDDGADGQFLIGNGSLLRNSSHSVSSFLIPYEFPFVGSIC